MLVVRSVHNTTGSSRGIPRFVMYITRFAVLAVLWYRWIAFGLLCSPKRPGYIDRCLDYIDRTEMFIATRIVSSSMMGDARDGSNVSKHVPYSH